MMMMIPAVKFSRLLSMITYSALRISSEVVDCRSKPKWNISLVLRSCSNRIRTTGNLVDATAVAHTRERDSGANKFYQSIGFLLNWNLWHISNALEC